MKITPSTALLSFALLAPVAAAQNLLVDPGFETSATGQLGPPQMPPIVVPSPTWESFGNAFVELINPAEYTPRSGNHLCKMFRNFASGGFEVSGIFQRFPAAPGQTFTIDCWSRHWSGDALMGGAFDPNATGPQNTEWAVMKIAFFDNGGGEISGVEGLILDSTSPTDTWIDNTPVSGIAPPGTVEVQALFLFLSPASYRNGSVGNPPTGSLQLDDLEFTLVGGGAGTYPGNAPDLVLATGIGGASPSFGPGNDVKQVSIAAGGSVLELNVSSPGGTYDLRPYLVLGQLFGTGFPPQALPFPFDALWFNFGPASPIIILQTPMGSPIGGQLIGPNGGTSLYYVIPPSFSGSNLSLMVQALWVDPTASNGIYESSDAHELQFQ